MAIRSIPLHCRMGQVRRDSLNLGSISITNPMVI